MCDNVCSVWNPLWLKIKMASRICKGTVNPDTYVKFCFCGILICLIYMLSFHCFSSFIKMILLRFIVMKVSCTMRFFHQELMLCNTYNFNCTLEIVSIKLFHTELLLSSDAFCKYSFCWLIDWCFLLKNQPIHTKG